MDTLFPILIAIIIVAVFGIILSIIVNAKSRVTTGAKRQKERQVIVKEATKKLTSDPHNINALTELGNLYYKEQDWAKAYPLYTSLVSLSSSRMGINLAEVTLRHGICALNLAKPQEALKSLLVFLLVCTLTSCFFNTKSNLSPPPGRLPADIVPP